MLRFGRLRSERGQALILFVGLFTVILVVAVIVVDVGLWLAERRSAQRAADFAAAAGAQDLLEDDGAAFASACLLAGENGYEEQYVTIELLARASNDPAWQAPCGEATPPASGSCTPVCDTVRVTVSKPGARLFSALDMFGIAPFDVEAGAAAGLVAGGGAGAPSPTGTPAPSGPQQTVLVFDAQASMTTPLAAAKAAAHQYIDTLLSVSGGGAGAVGYAAYNYCYTPPLEASRGCIIESSEPNPEVVELGTDTAGLHAALDRTETGYQGYPCMALWRAKTMLASQPSAGPRSIVFLTNGDNRYPYYLQFYPPVECRPTPIVQPPLFSNGCETPKPWEPTEDVLTYQLAQAIKASGVEIYIVGLNVCGADDGKTQNTGGYCAAIGNQAHDNIADQRLLKCIASSPEHYVDVDAAGLMGAFQDVASGVLGRGLVQ
ncbi:MAG: pilus assembly protein TadG-related protein [Dehalococcoidia bacterium]